MINSKDISVVVQGAIDKINTKLCLQCIRKQFPYAEVILSTWEGSNVSNLDYDIVLFNKDPGAALCSNAENVLNNVNREIVSTFNGIKQAKNKYILKIRSDLILNGKNILKCFFKSFKRKPLYSFFDKRIVVCSIYSRFYSLQPLTNNKIPVIFHPSDWLYFGLRDDLYALFNIPLTEEPFFSQYFKNKKNFRFGFNDSHPNRLWKFSPEAYIFTEYLKQKGINIEDKLDLTDNNIELSRNIMVNNFYMADQISLSLIMPKYSIYQPLMPKIDRDGLYSNYRWQKEYKRYIDKNYKVKLTYTEFLGRIFDLFHFTRRSR